MEPTMEVSQDEEVVMSAPHFSTLSAREAYMVARWCKDLASWYRLWDMPERAQELDGLSDRIIQHVKESPSSEVVAAQLKMAAQMIADIKVHIKELALHYGSVERERGGCST